jgi:hypothetical protein
VVEEVDDGILIAARDMEIDDLGITTMTSGENKTRAVKSRLVHQSTAPIRYVAVTEE